MYLIFDIGGSGTKIAVVDEQLQVRERQKIKRCPDQESFLAMLFQESDRACREYPIRGIGISSPGTVDPESGEVGGVSALEYIHQVNFARLLQAHAGLPLTIENDAKCAALGELEYGRTGCRDFAMITVGTGIGGAVVLDGKLRRGARGEAGEFGQIFLRDRNNELVFLSRLSTLPNLAARMRRKRPAWGNSYKLFDDALAGVEPAKSAVEQMLANLLTGLHNLRYSFDPEKFFIGGAISQSPEYIDWLRRCAAKEPFARDRLQIEPASFGNDNNIFGALSLIIKKTNEVRT